MGAKIIKQNKNPFLHREEFVIEFESESNPSFDDIKKVLGGDEELIVVKRINSNFGKKIFTAEVVVYDSKETKEKTEKIIKKGKDKKDELKKPEEKAEEAPAEKPEQTEEIKKEETETKPEEKTDGN